MKHLLGALLFILSISNSYAYSIFTLKPVNWSQVKSVDVFIAGYGEEMGLQFLNGAITRAQKHDELYPDSRAQVVMWAEEWNRWKDGRVLKDRGMHIRKINSRHLDNEEIIEHLLEFPKISSLHIVSHNAAFQGGAIQRASDRMGPYNFPWEKLRSKMTSDSYVFLHGCNTGFIVAPEVSKKLQKPVLGSLTSTDFQEIFENGQWYHNNPQFGQFPKGMEKLTTSGELFMSRESCWKGFCHRMMPNIHPYRGHWGDYEVGLPYYQVFCDENVGEKSCKKGAAHALFTTLTINPKDWQSKVEDFMCPRMADPDTYQNCLLALEGKSEEKVFWGNTIACTRSRCDYDLKAAVKHGNRIQNFVGRDVGLGQFQKDFSFFMDLESWL